MTTPAAVNAQDYWTVAKAGNSDVWMSTPNRVEFMATNAQNYQFNGSFSTVKSNGDNGSEYHFAWAAQVNSKTNPGAANYLQLWWSPKWNVATPTGYTNYICQRKGDGTEQTQTMRNTPDPLYNSLATGPYSKVDSTGDQAIDSFSSFTQGTSSKTIDSVAWYSFYCTGFRKAETANQYVSAFQVGDTITYTTGFRYSQTSSATSPIAGAGFGSTDLTEVVMERSGGAVSQYAVSAVAAATSIALLLF